MKKAEEESLAYIIFRILLVFAVVAVFVFGFYLLISGDIGKMSFDFFGSDSKDSGGSYYSGSEDSDSEERSWGDRLSDVVDDEEDDVVPAPPVLPAIG